MNKLAIVIPYYKIDFFEDTLISLSNQTNPKFTVYIGDDLSPHCPVNLISKYKDKLNIIYRKFEYNIGNVNLVGQWKRCVVS